MTAAYVAGAIANANGTSVSVTIPAGAAAGQVAVLDFGWNNSASAFSALSGVGGWTLLDTEKADASVSKRVYYKVLASGDNGSSVTASITAGAKCHLAVEVYSGIDTSSPIDSFAWSLEPGTSAAHAGAGVTTSVNGCMIYTSVTDKNGALTSWTQPTGFTLRHSTFTTATAVSGATADKLQTTAGAITPDNWTADTATDKAVVLTLALAPTAVAGNPTADVVRVPKETADATGSTPGAGGTLSYSWTQLSGPAVTLDTSVTGKATFTRPVPLTADVVLQVTVTESPSGHTATKSITIPADGGASSHLVYDGTDWV